MERIEDVVAWIDDALKIEDGDAFDPSNRPLYWLTQAKLHLERSVKNKRRKAGPTPNATQTASNR